MTSLLKNGLVRFALLSVLLIGPAVSTQAGPGPHLFYPMTTPEAETVKTGDTVAVRCGKCGAVSVFTAGKDLGFMHHLVCPHCKTEFHTRIDAHGNQHGEYTLVSDAGDKLEFLSAATKRD